MKEKFKNVLNIIGIINIILTVIVFNLVIGANEKNLRIMSMGTFMGISIAILFIKKIIFKEKLIKSNVDIAVTLFMMCTLLPFIFNTYCTIQGTIEFILKYFFIYSIYLLVRHVVDTKKKINILIYTTIFASLIPIILGIDLMNGNYFDSVLQKLNLKYTDDYRFSSTFGYANAASIYVMFCVFLAINRIENTKKIPLKIICFLYIILGTYIIYISYSRVILILYVIFILGYIFKKIYEKIKNNKQLLKYIIIIVIGIFAFIVMYLAIAMGYSKPYEVGDTNKFRKKFNPNQTYNIEFFIDVINDENYKSYTTLNIIEVNEYFKETKLASVHLTDSRQVHEIEITPSEDVYYIKFEVVNYGNKKVVIDKCYIDGEEYIFSYKYVPRVIYRLITSFGLSDDSILLRKQYYENSIRIWKDSPIIGHGGNSWRMLSTAYQEYYYSVKETHSYFFELLISYGVIGVAAFLVLIYYIIKTFIKDEEKKKKLLIFIGLLLLIGYNFVFDFGMSFVVILLTVFEYISIIQFENKEEKNIKFLDYLVFIVLGIVFVVLVRANIAMSVEDYKDKVNLAPYVSEYQYKNIDEKDFSKSNLENVKQYMLHEPYSFQNNIYKMYWKLVFNNVDILSDEELKDYINFGIERLNTVKSVAQMDFDKILERMEIIKDVINSLENIANVFCKEKAEQLKEQLNKEYELNMSNLKDTRRNKYSDYIIDMYIKKYEEILN